MGIEMKTAAEALEEERKRPRLTTGFRDLDELIGGLEQGQFYLFYGADGDLLDLLIHRILVNCTLPIGGGGLNAKALYLNLCNYYAEKTLLSPTVLGALAKGVGADPERVFRRVYSLFAFNEKQQGSAAKEAINLLNRDREIRLLVIHNLTRFLETSKKPEEAREALREMINSVRQVAAEYDVTLVASGGASRGRRVVLKPLGWPLLRRVASVMVFVKKLDAGAVPSVKLYLVKHPRRETPRSITLHFSQGGMDVMGRVTPSFRRQYLAQVEKLKKRFQEALLNPEDREAFNLLIRDAWTPEDHALGNVGAPTVLDSLNLMANVHNKRVVEALRRRVEELEERVRELESGGSGDGEDGK